MIYIIVYSFSILSFTHSLWCSLRYTGEGEGGISNITVVEAKMVSSGWAAD